MAEQYQSFTDAAGASRSFQKLKLLRLPDMKGKSFLDVGCNEGFFCAVAHLAGAERVVGIEASPQFVERAKRRFPSLDFRNQSWDDPIDGQFDVILFSSAIHYADDQPAVLRKLLSHLTPQGMMILELGISDAPGNEYVPVKRALGDTKWYATRGALAQALDGYCYRYLGASVNQSGDPVPRYVVRITRPRATILMLDAPSMSGKSSLAKLLSKGRGGAKEPGFILVSLDGTFAAIQSGMAAQDGHRAVIERIAEFKKSKSERADLLMEMLYAEGLLPDFLSYVETARGFPSAELILWDGYVPERARGSVVEFFRERNYLVWGTQAHESLNYERIDLKSVLAPLPTGEALRTSRTVRAYLDTITPASGGLTLHGWGVDTDAGAPVDAFLVFADGKNVGKFDVSRQVRADAARSAKVDAETPLGFKIHVPHEALAGDLPAYDPASEKRPQMRLFCIAGDGGVCEVKYPAKAAAS